MKKIITSGVFCLIACWFLSSCGSNFSITKRHFNPGYYIDYTKGNPTITPKVAAKPVQPALVAKPTEQSQPAQLAKLANSEQNSKLSASNASGIVAVNKQMKAKAILNLIAKQAQKNSIAVVEGENTQVKNYSPDAVTMTNSNSEHGGGGGRSLLLLLL